MVNSDCCVACMKQTNEEILNMVQEDREILKTIRCRKHKWMGHVLWHDGLLCDVVMGDSAKKKTIRFDLVPQTSRFDSIRFDSLLCQKPPRQSTPGVLDSDPEAAAPVHRSHDWPAYIATAANCLCRSEWRH